MGGGVHAVRPETKQSGGLGVKVIRQRTNDLKSLASLTEMPSFNPLRNVLSHRLVGCVISDCGRNDFGNDRLEGKSFAEQ
jgi:hypothetical protein